MIPFGILGSATPRGNPSPGSAPTWDAATKSGAAVLTNSDYTLARASSSGNYANVRSLLKITGKLYFSVATVWGSSDGRNGGVGIADSTWVSSSNLTYIGEGNSVGLWGPGDGANNWRVYRNGSTLHNGSTPIGNIEVAVDASTRNVWIRSSGGSWIGGGNPATGTTPTASIPGTGDLYAAASSYATTGWATRTFTLQSTLSAITGVVPSGFKPGFNSAFAYTDSAAAGSITVGTTFTDYLSVPITTLSGNILIRFDGTGYGNSSLGAAKVLVDGVDIGTTPIVNFGADWGFVTCVQVVATVSAGSHTIKVQLKSSSGTKTLGLSGFFCSLSVQEF